MGAPSGTWWHLSCTRCDAGLAWYGTEGSVRPQHRCQKDHRIRDFNREAPMRAPAKDPKPTPQLRGTPPGKAVAW